MTSMVKGFEMFILFDLRLSDSKLGQAFRNWNFELRSAFIFDEQ